jgi:monofunctional biosynthetic peptidoglycan transglycosylase
MVLRSIRILLSGLGWAAAVCVLWVLLFVVVDPPVTWLMCDQAMERDHIERDWKGLSEIDRALPLAVIASEDQNFMYHYGYSWQAMSKAMERNRKGGKVRGGSTISQQTAKNVFLWPGRSYIRKGLEFGFTLLMETFWSKERILEVYLNVAEMGPGRFGAEAAAQGCFGIPAKKLGKTQAALLAVVLPSPRRYDCKRPGPYVQRRQQWTLRQMRNIGDVLDPEVRARIEKKRDQRAKRSARKKSR